MTSSRISDPQTYIEDSENSIIKLKLKKPKSWNWELSTSKSSPNINFPKILLYDHKNNILAETDESNCVVNDKKDGKLKNGKVVGRNQTLSSTSTVASNKNETKRSPKTNIDSNCIYSSIDPNPNHSTQTQNESLSHQSKNDTNSTSTLSEPLKYRRKRSLSVSFNEMKHFLNNLKHQLNGSGIDCKITNHSSERKYSNKIDSFNEHKHLNENFNETQLRRIKSISDINPTKKGSKQNLPESATALMYNENGCEKSALRKSFKGKEYTGMPSSCRSSSCRTMCSVGNVDEHKRTATETVNGTDIFENDVYLTGNQTTSKRNNFLLTKSKSSMEVVSSDVQRTEKKKYRRAHSTNSLKFSSSILERISEFKRRSSSTDSEEIGSNSTEHTPTKPRYFLRTSQAGTLLICNESFRNRRRRRPRSYSKINENGECTGSRTVNDTMKSKEQKNASGDHRDNTDFFANGTYNGTLPEESYENLDNFDKCSNRYETAIANIDDLIAKVVSSNRTESMNGNANCKENISINKKSCCCNDEIPITDEYRIENELDKNESAENLIKNRDNQLDKCINFSDGVGAQVVREKRKKRAKSLGKNGYSTNKCKNDSCGKVQKFQEKVRCRSASVGSECHSSSSSEDDFSTKNPQRGRSRVKRRRRQQSQPQGEIFH